MPSEMFSKSRREELALGPANRRPKNKPTAAKARITVAVRKKPLTAEEAKNDTDILDVVGRQKLVLHETRKELSGTTDKTTQQGFQFDRVYDEYCSNLTIYKSCVRTLVDSMFECGGRCSCFAFGQTGSGKTYTMMGPRKRGGKQEDSCSRGLWEWAAIDLEAWMKKPAYRERFVLAISFYEIHSNKAYDLLNNRNLVRPMESAEGGVVVKDLVIRVVTTEAEMAEVIDLGNSVRSTGKNSRNNESSRSHAILSIELVQKTDIEYRLAENPRAENPRAENPRAENPREGAMGDRNGKLSATALQTALKEGRSVAVSVRGKAHGKLAFIDLAGSERGADSVQFGRNTQQDGANINKSLLALKECIRAMDQGKDHIPFRDSELTKVLRDFFTFANGLCLMIATVASSSTRKNAH
ncbi:kinesin motor domain protein [Gregarina niphandrodes]|uniref:Kinesin-like protein n=1 Tax=Gregarina niphandrodes TaxID=110365 RepID=A0A023B4U9_GRENI|nr:kinesin motor domain protein [Gregarina niphandrodes]EZG57318.1 kinesin motor domain protein [Gregarina niphandrodes]|eukprot:XP_011131057.1 kinesin motor domain protein [Gregarina niphandrodes]